MLPPSQSLSPVLTVSSSVRALLPSTIKLSTQPSNTSPSLAASHAIPGESSTAVGQAVPASLTQSPTSALQPISMGGQILTANPSSQYDVAGQTLVPEGPPITVSGTRISLAVAAPALFIGSSTVPWNPGPALMTGLPILTLAGTTYTAETAGDYIIGSQTLSPGGQAITISGTPISIPHLDPVLIIGTSTQVLYGSPVTDRPQITIAGTVYTADTAGDFLVGSQTLIPGAPALIIAGTQISLAPSASALVIGTRVETLTPNSSPEAAPPLITIAGTTYTANAAGAYLNGSKTLSPGGPAITVSGTPVSLGPAASILVIATSTETLRPNSPITAAQPLITIAGSTYTADAAGDYIIGSQTLRPGAPAITVSGTVISLAPSASDVFIGTSTEILRPNLPITATLPLINIAGTTYTADAAGNYIIGSQTLIPGGPAIVISGTPISLAPSASDLVIDTSTETLIASHATSFPPITIAGKTYTTNAAGNYLIGSQTLTPGARGITVSGTPVFLAPGGADVLVGTSVETLVAQTTSSAGIGGVILSALGGGAAATGTATGMAFTGGCGGVDRASNLYWGFIAAALGWMGRVDFRSDLQRNSLDFVWLMRECAETLFLARILTIDILMKWLQMKNIVNAVNLDLIETRYDGNRQISR